MKKKLPLFILLVFLFFLGSLAQTAIARNVNVETDTIVTISEDTDGALAVSGQDIMIEGDVNGALFAAGNSITVKGDVNGPVFVAGNSILIEGTIEGEVFIAGNTIRTTNASAFSRDAFIAGSEILLNGKIGRDLYGGSEQMAINHTIGRNVRLSTSTLTVGANAAVGGDMFYQANTEVPNLNQYVDGQVRFEQARPMDRQQEMSQQIIFRRVIHMIGALVSALIMWWLLRKLTHNWWITVSLKNLNRPLPLLLLGLGLLLLTPILIILAFLSRILSGLGFFLILLFMLLIFLNRIITASIIGKYLLEHRMSFTKYQALAGFLVAYLLLYLAGLIPIIGGIITFLSIIYAIGLVSSEAFHHMQKNPTI